MNRKVFPLNWLK